MAAELVILGVITQAAAPRDPGITRDKGTARTVLLSHNEIHLEF